MCVYFISLSEFVLSRILQGEVLSPSFSGCDAIHVCTTSGFMDDVISTHNGQE